MPIETDPDDSGRGKKSSSKESAQSSQVGAAMRELTGKRVIIGIMAALFLTILFTYSEADGTNENTMLALHGQTANAQFRDLALNTARDSVISKLYTYERHGNDTDFSRQYNLPDKYDPLDLRTREILNITICGSDNEILTFGLFDNRETTHNGALVELFATVFIIFIWVVGVTAFAGPVMTLVVNPIERMVQLLSMLMKDPLGYQNSPQYQDFISNDNDISNNTMFTKDVLKGMETNFLMSTILRIGSLMKVGFGSAGVEIIRNNLERGGRKDVLFLNQGGQYVSCIFLFSDIRSFTDATESLQEEVFVFTNKIAGVVHSICHAYGGDANKNIGDAFLLSWRLDEAPIQGDDDVDSTSSLDEMDVFIANPKRFYANSNQADKALLSVVKICIALYYDTYFIESMNEDARNRLMSKLSDRKGPVVQMGFGLHAGKAVQGAIGSQRKLDATYISESVERSEFLESSTKQYGIPLLMSDDFYDLLESTNRYRCRKIDQLIFLSEDDDHLSLEGDLLDSCEKMDIFTYDMDVDALWRSHSNNDDGSSSSSYEARVSGVRSSPIITRNDSSIKRSKIRRKDIRHSRSEDAMVNMDSIMTTDGHPERPAKPARILKLPTGTKRYSDRVWLEHDMKKIRHRYVANGLFFSKFGEGLRSYYSQDWGHAKSCFDLVLIQVENDGPSRYFLKCMDKHNGVPPRDFIGYGR